MKRSLICLSSVAAAIVIGLAACEGCGAAQKHVPADAAVTSVTPTVRVYILSSIAGALEPCGCSKDQLGGMDRLAAYIQGEDARAPNRIVVGAGPMFFSDPVLETDRKTQNEWKAEAIAVAAKTLQLTAWTPGANDFAAGAEALTKLNNTASTKMVASNFENFPMVSPFIVQQIGAHKIGIVGVSEPRKKDGAIAADLRLGLLRESMKKAVQEAISKGCTILVGLAAVPRGEALRMVDDIPELNVLVMGKPFETGDLNDVPKAPELVNKTLVVETSNHAQTVGVIDLFVHDEKEKPIVFMDGSGIEKQNQLISLSSRIRELEARIRAIETDKSVSPVDVEARKVDLQLLKAQKAKLEERQPIPSGNYFLYQLVEIRESLGRNADVSKGIHDYYVKVNEHNKVAFADRKPIPVTPGQASYVGVEVCSTCHEEERKVWDGTLHSHAYETLQKGAKEYNLDCVNCHVTGYGKPGGSTVAFNEDLRGVQCEECHGPGSLHAKSPSKKGLIQEMPSMDLCTTACHHPPHVEGFDPREKLKFILGPGHGQ